MKKVGGRTSASNIDKLLFLTFIFFLLVTTSTEQQSKADETPQIANDSPNDIFPEAERISYAPGVSHKEGKVLSGLGQDPDSSYGNHGPFVVSPDANNRDAASVDDTITIDGNHPSGSDLCL